MPDNDKFDEMIDRVAKGYRDGSRPPADRIWSRIEGDVAGAIRGNTRVARLGRHWPWLAAATGIAAALVIGVVIGRRSMIGTVVPTAQSPQPIAAVTADSAREAVMRAVTMSHLSQAGVFLTEVRADLKTGRRDPERGVRSRHLLARTRLLIAHDAPRTPAVERLLEDLELVLAEIAALPDSGKRRAIDARLLDERLRVGTVLPRIRSIVPPSPAMAGEGL